VIIAEVGLDMSSLSFFPCKPRTTNAISLS
jgi:hypothetical protein